MQRPTSVTVVAWVILAMAGEAIAGSSSSMAQPILRQLADPQVGVPLTVLLGLLVEVAIVISAVLMLRGASWARIVYAALAGFVVFGMVVSSFRVSGMVPIAGYATIRTAVLLYFLFRADANAYFSGSARSVGAERARGLS